MAAPQDHPGALDADADLDAAATLREPPKSASHRPPRPDSENVSEAELDRSLAGLDVAGQENQPPTSPGKPSVAPRGTQSEWVWYAAAAAILLLGLLGYVFR